MAKPRKSGKRAKIGRKLDKVLFGIPEDRARYMRTGKNPAKDRARYRLGFTDRFAGRKNPAQPKDTYYMAGWLDGAKRNAGESKFAKCVREVSAKGGAYDPRAVCAAAGRKKLGRAEMTRRAIAGKKRAAKRPKRNPRNPLDTAQSAYAGFHGEQPKGATVIQEKSHYHTHVWEVGKLVLLRVLLPSDRRQPGLSNIVDVEFNYESKTPAHLTANEKRNQLFIDGGDQAVDIKTFGIDPAIRHEKELLGYLKQVWYYTDKKHLGKEGGRAIYKHKLGEEGGELPALVYRTIDKRLEIVGGSYTIPDEGVRN